MNSRATISADWVRSIAIGIDGEGLDARRLMTRVGLDASAPRQQEFQNSLQQVDDLWQAAMAESGRPHLGLAVARHFSLAGLPALDTALLSASNLGDAARRLGRFLPVLSRSLGATFESRKAESRMQIRCADVFPGNVDMLLAVCVSILRELPLEELRLRAVRLQRPEPTDTAPYEAFFGCPVSFSPASSLICWRSASREKASAAADDWDEMSDHLIESYLEHLEVDPVATQVRAEIVRLLPAGEPSLDEVAWALATSARTLQRRLDAARTSLSGMIRSARQELCNRYLGDPRLSLRDITYLLGYSDQGNFSRAFRQWYGTPPGQYRRQLQSRRQAQAE